MDATHPLKQYRESRNLTLEELAKQIGVPAPTISRWENYKRAPRRGAIDLIVEKTGLSKAEAAGFQREPAE